MDKIYYVYIITYEDNKKYIGYRGCKSSPWKDTKYLGSGTYTPNNKVKSKNILFVSLSGREAFNIETRLLELVDAKNNPNYYNAHNNDRFAHTEWTEEKRKSHGKIISEVCKRPEVKSKRSQLSLDRWADPVMVAKIKANRSKVINSEAHKEKHRVNTTNMWKTEEYRDKMKDLNKDKSNGRYDHSWYILTNTDSNLTVVVQRYHIRNFASDWLGIGKSKCFRLIDNIEITFRGWYVSATHEELGTEGPYCLI